MNNSPFIYINNCKIANLIRKKNIVPSFEQLLPGQSISINLGTGKKPDLIQVTFCGQTAPASFDMCVLDCISSIYEEQIFLNGAKNKEISFTVKHIWQLMTGVSTIKITPNTLDKISDSINNLMSSKLVIAGDEVPFLIAEKSPKKAGRFLLKTDNPLPFYLYAKEKKQVIAIHSSLMKIKYYSADGSPKYLSNTVENVLLKWLLIQRLELLANKNNRFKENRIIYERRANGMNKGIFAELGIKKEDFLSDISFAHKRHDVHENIVKILNYYEALEYFDWFEVIKNKNKITGISISPRVVPGKDLDEDVIYSDFDEDKRLLHRIQTICYRVLNECIKENGNTFIPYEEFDGRLKSFIRMDETAFKNYLKRIFKNDYNLTADETDVYLKYLQKDEKYIAKKLKIMLKNPVNPLPDLEDKIAAAQEKTEVKLDESQLAAVKLMAGNRVSILTGGPGTGKTACINVLTNIYKAAGLKVQMLAPTGKAVENIIIRGGSARTIHSYLGINEYDFDSMLGPGRKNAFNHNEYNRMEADVIIIDEMSMVDVPLFFALLKALSLDSILVLVGDEYQLPSIGPGNVLGDLIDSQVLPCATLSVIHRREEDSVLNEFALKIKEKQEISYSDYSNSDQIRFIKTQYEREKLLNEITDRICSEKDRIKTVILTPKNEGKYGVNEINKRIQLALERKHTAEGHTPKNTSTISIAEDCMTFYEGDRVIQTVNNYSLENKKGKKEIVFNGEIGIIKEINLRSKYMVVAFSNNKYVKYSVSLFDQLNLAYALTIHKAQGSEFDYVGLFLPLGATSGDSFISQNMIYTAITRAKENISIISTENQFNYHLKEGKMCRNTKLKTYLTQD